MLNKAREGGKKESWSFLLSTGQREVGVQGEGIPSLYPQALTAVPSPLKSTAKKIDIIKGLFVACRHSEARFIAR